MLLALGCAFATCAAHAQTDLSTHAERSQFRETGRYAEVIALCDAFARHYPETVRCFDFGTTPEGRPMKALAISASGALDAGSARQRQLPVLLVQGGIHAGEIDGKDAVFWLLRDLLQTREGLRLLQNQVLLFVPVFNADGHENFRAWQRPNQRGPEAMGFRTTARRYNLNRDYIKADSSEMQAMLALVNEWDPLVMMDLHATNGAQFEHDIAFIVHPVKSGDAALQAAGRQLRDGLIEGLRKAGSKPLDFYPSFIEHDNPASGFSDGVPTARFSHGYFPLRNRIGVLVETHSWRTYPERVLATRHSVAHLLRLAHAHGQQWLRTAHAADRRTSSLAGQEVPLQWRVSEHSQPIDFLGYHYTRSVSEISGALMTRYDESRPEVWRVGLRREVTPALSVRAPAAGYLVPAAWAGDIARQLRHHGITFHTLDTPLKDAAVEQFTAHDIRFATSSLEGHQTLSVDGQWQAARQDFASGSLFVPIAQPKAVLLMHILEPQAPDSVLSWGQVNTAFESKEYMEAYVTEAEARKMLAADPALRADFERRLREDSAFAASPRARLEFFYRRHPAWDEGYGRYPVVRTDQPPAH